MTATVHPPTGESLAQPPQTPDISQLLATAAKERRDDVDYYRHALALITGWLDAPLAMLDIRAGAQTLELQQLSASTARPDLVTALQALLLDTESSQRTSIREVTADRLMLLSVPVEHPRMGQVGALVVAVRPNQRSPQQRLCELQSIAALITSLRAANLDAAIPNNVQKALERASKYDSIRELAYALVNSLAQRMNCPQVSLGVMKDQKIQLEAISGLDRFSNRSPQVVQLRQAMEECADAGHSVMSQPGGKMRLHRQLQQRTSTTVLSVPLRVDGKCTGVITFQSEDESFDESDVAEIEDMTAAFSPAIHLLKRMNDRPSKRMIQSAWSAMFSRTAGWRFGAIGAFSLACLAFGIFLFGSMNYSIRCDGTLAPSDSRVVSAPFGGALTELYVRPGDAVSKGQLIAKLDTDPLSLEQHRLRSELNIKRISIAQHLERREADLASLAMAESEAIVAQLDAVTQQLKKAAVRSPINGVVLRGDWEQHLGQTVAQGETLIEVGNRMNRVELVIPERLAPEIAVGMTAKFLPMADPGKSVGCRITRVQVSAEPLKGESVVRAEAVFEDEHEWTIAGMEGVARVDAGPRRIWWICLHRAIRWFQRGLA